MTRQKLKYKSWWKDKGIYKNYPLQEYLLEDLGSGKELHILWRSLPIQKKVEGPITSADKERQKHIGEYWYILHWLKPLGFFNTIEKEKEYYFPTLHDLKIAINTEFKNHNYAPHYKVK